VVLGRANKPAAPETGVKRIVYDADSSTIHCLTMPETVRNDLETTHTILLAAMSSPVTNAGCAH